MVSRARRTDSNQAEIASALRDVGASVHTLQMEADGLPDLLVGYQGANYLIEVKTATGTRTPKQIEFFRDWRGQKALVRTVAEALAVLGIEIQNAAPAQTIGNAEIIALWAANHAQLQTKWGSKWNRRRA